MTAAGPAFVAARYDRTHVVFVVASDTESRFPTAPALHFSSMPARIPASPNPAAPLAGLQELYEPDSQVLHFFPKLIQQTQPSERWTVNLSPDVTIPVIIQRPVIAPIGCSLALGFLSQIPPDERSTFAGTSREYFAVRRTSVESVDSPVTAHLGELPEWKLSPVSAKRIEQQLNERMKQELTKIDTRLLANAGTPGAAAGEFPIAGARPRLKEWLRADQGLIRGEGKLDYDLRAFRLTPDGIPRLFVRARWTLAQANVFLMTVWFKAGSTKTESRRESTRARFSTSESPHGASTEPASVKAAAFAEDSSVVGTQPVLLSADTTWSTELRDSDATGALGNSLDFQSVLNEFDADRDGWAELLVHSREAASTTITLYLYTDLGLVPLKNPLTRESRSPESCLAP